MKAVLCKEYGPPDSLVVEDVASPTPNRGEVLLAVRAAGVNFPDVLIIQNKYQFRPPLPFAPGGEVAGVVTALGEGVTTLEIGDRVIGSTGWGGFAEELAVDASRTIAIPDEMDFVTASAFLMTYGTSHHALKDRAHLREGETLLVLGAAGGVGLAAVELGKLMGARVIAAASTPEKLAVCREHGADELIDYAREDLKERVKQLTSGNGVDVVYDPIGGAYAETALRGTAWDGRYLVVGFAAGDIPKIPLNLVLLKGCQIVGVFWGAFTVREPERHRANIAELMTWFRAGKLKPHVSATFPLERAAEALNAMAERRVMGKVVLVPGSAE
ncbi:MAG: NADPH:quinone oxidoreductase family protein [Deltaproteobacteria bacterium]|nr:MAG: NADPH:quinone oxidoreductase family protein [Deltaproteobacteria bacterium]